MKCVPLSVIGFLLTASPVWADVAPMIPFTKMSRARHRIETRESYLEYVFVLVREGYVFDTTKGWNEYREAQYVEITPERPLVFELADCPTTDPVVNERRKERAQLVAVPRVAAEPYKSADALLKAGGSVPLEILEFYNWRTTVPEWGDDPATITHRVQRKGDRLEVIRTSGDPVRRLFAAVGFTVAAVFVGGFWLSRRLWRRTG